MKLAAAKASIERLLKDGQQVQAQQAADEAAKAGPSSPVGVATDEPSVNPVPQVEVDVPPIPGIYCSRRKTFGDVLGDPKFTFDDGVRMEDDVSFGAASTDQQTGADEISPRSLETRMTLRNEKWAALRPVNAVRFPRKNDDVLLTAHAASKVALPGNGNGVVNMWSLAGGDSRLQRTLVANASMSALLLPTLSPEMVAGGTATGDILLWDLRARASTPVQVGGGVARTRSFEPICARICALAESPSNKMEFFSAATNGSLCLWSLSSLGQPLSRIEVRDMNEETKSETKSEMPVLKFGALAVSTGQKKYMGTGRFAKYTHYMFAGGQEGNVYQLGDHTGEWSVGLKRAVHKSPITSLSFHPTKRGWSRLSDVVLSASMDWTVKLTWASATKQEPKTYKLGMPGVVREVEWSPVSPCIFATGDENGTVSLFDAEKSFDSTEPPSCRHTLEDTGKHAGPSAPVSALDWRKDGRHLVAGDTDGNVAVWKCANKIVDPTSKEWDRLSYFLNKQGRATIVKS